jgi:hypothetical protein
MTEFLKIFNPQASPLLRLQIGLPIYQTMTTTNSTRVLSLPKKAHPKFVNLGIGPFVHFEDCQEKSRDCRDDRLD